MPRETSQGQPAGDSEYCRVIVRVREGTHQGVMRLLSASGQGDNLSALVDDLLAQWLASHEANRPASKRTPKPGK
jgi:hypothetical protein